MSQQVAAATAPAPPAPSAGPAQSVATAQSAPAAETIAAQSTPRRLRRWSLVLIVTCVLFGVLASLTFVLLASALGRASASTAQLIRVQQIQTNLLAADATATNAFLVGGLEPPAQRKAYDDAITSATSGLARAAEAEPADAAVLAALNQQLVTYVALIEDARTNNRQGFPVGAQYQRVASSTLRADAMPLLDNLVEANGDRAESQMTTWQIAVLVVAGLGALTILVLAQVWLARRFRRRLNPAVVAATAVVVVAWLIGLTTIGSTNVAVGGIRTGSFADVNKVATARVQGFDAKSNESLTLIARGSGTAFEQAWQKSAAVVAQNLNGQLGGTWNRYVTVHKEIRALDDAGKWDQAVARATGTGPDSANVAFGAFDTQTATQLERATNQTANGLDGSRIGLIIGAMLSLLAGLVAAVLARRGVETRLREYR